MKFQQVYSSLSNYTQHVNEKENFWCEILEINNWKISCKIFSLNSLFNLSCGKYISIFISKLLDVSYGKIYVCHCSHLSVADELHLDANL